jgi:hypothetical protein
LKKHLTRCSIKKYNDLNNLENKIEDTKDEIKDDNEIEITLNKLLENNKKIQLELEELKKIKSLAKSNNIYKKLDIIKNDIQRINQNAPINHFMNIIIDQTKKIEELNKLNKCNQEIIDNNQEIIEDIIIEPRSLLLNKVIIESRLIDNYINATQLCEANYKNFNDWYKLENTTLIINRLASKTGISVSVLIENNKEDLYIVTWIHPKLAIQLAQWISPIVALKVSDWILDLFTNTNADININNLKNQSKEIKLKNQRIQLLEDMVLKKHKRTEYPEKNVIYILTTEDHKKNRIYIIGKAITLKNRLGSYNKTAEHEVVYYKECRSEDEMHIIELIVLNKLQDYKEIANRDRFILPIEKDISFFTDIIDESITFFN